MSKLVIGEVTVQFAFFTEASNAVDAESKVVRLVRDTINSENMKVVGRPRNVEVRNEDGDGKEA